MWVRFKEKIKTDETKLHDLYKSNRVARAFFDHMVKRERNQSETKVDRILMLLNDSEGDKFSRGDIVELFKQLQELDCGQFIPGRHGWPSRLVWRVSSLSASRVATGESEEVEVIADESEIADQASDFLKHVFNLRADMPVDFKLPVDLTENEAHRLADFVKTLPMEEYD